MPLPPSIFRGIRASMPGRSRKFQNVWGSFNWYKSDISNSANSFMPSWVSHDFPKMDNPGRNSSFSPGENQENSWFLPGFPLGKACLSAFHQGRISRFSPGENLVNTCPTGFHQGKCSFPGRGAPSVLVGIPSKHQVLTMGKPGVFQANTR